MIRDSAIRLGLSALAISLVIGASVGWAPCAIAEGGEVTPTLGPFSSEWVEIVNIKVTVTPNEGGVLSIALRNKSEQSLWVTLVVRTPDPTQDREITGMLDAGGTETFKCSQTMLIPKKDYRLLVQIYKDEGLRTLLGSPETTFRFRKSDVDKFAALVASAIPPRPAGSSAESTVWLQPKDEGGTALPASPQTAYPLRKGNRIRVNTSTAYGRFTGNVEAFDDSTITLSAVKDAGATVIRRQEITKLAVSAGRRGSRGGHAAAGGAIGAGVGALIGLASGDDDPSQFLPLTAGEKAVILAVPFALVGALIGVALPVEHWQQVPVDRVVVSVESVHGRAGLSLSYSF